MDTLISPTAFQPQSCKPGLERLTSDVFCGPLDTETISHRNERLLRTAQVMERLTRVERQNHKIMVLIFALTITAFVFLLMETTLLPKGGSLQMTQGLGPSVASGVTTDPRSGNPVTGAAAGKYAGVKTSNDYHLPGCEAAQTAAPEVLTAFDSVAAAKQQGFKPCPVCRPPNTD